MIPNVKRSRASRRKDPVERGVGDTDSQYVLQPLRRAERRIGEFGFESLDSPDIHEIKRLYCVEPVVSRNWIVTSLMLLRGSSD